MQISISHMTNIHAHIRPQYANIVCDHMANLHVQIVYKCRKSRQTVNTYEGMTSMQFREARLAYRMYVQPYLIEYWFVQRTFQPSAQAVMPQPVGMQTPQQCITHQGPPPSAAVAEPAVMQVSSECVTPKRPPPTLKPWAPKRKRTFKNRVLKYISTSQPLLPWRRRSPIVQTD